MNIGVAIRTVRKNKNITQKQLCELVGITQSYLSSVEKGLKIPSQKVIDKISKTIDCPLNYIAFLSLEEKDIPENKREIFKIMKPFIDNLLKL